METFDCIESRKSVRKYDKKDVPNNILAQVLTAATLAPSAGNTQEWEFVIIRDNETKKKLSRAALGQEQVEEAPVVIVVLANLEKIGLKYKERGKELYSVQDTAAATQNLLLAANDLGVGACWIGAFEENKVRTIIQAPNKIRPVAMITLGFPIPYEETKKIDKIPFHRVTWQERYGENLDWFMDYSRESRYQWKPLNEQIEELSKKLKRLREEREKTKKRGIVSKIKKKFKK